MSNQTRNNNDEDDNNDVIPPPPPSYFGNYSMPTSNISFEPMNDNFGEISRRVQHHDPSSASAMASISFDSTFFPSSTMTTATTKSNMINNTTTTSKKKPLQATKKHQSPKQTHIIKNKSSIATTTNNILDDNWKLQQENIPTLSQFDPLEITASFIPNVFNKNKNKTDGTLNGILKRIRFVLRSRNIKVLSERSKKSNNIINGTNKIKCMTKDHVDFRIYFYRGRNQYNHGMIVEIQRRYGISYSFKHDVSCILDAATTWTLSTSPIIATTTKEEQDEEQLLLQSATTSSIVSDDEDDDYTNSCTPDVTMSICNMVKSEYYDTKALGLQLLKTLLNSNKVGMKTSNHVLRQLNKKDEVYGGGCGNESITMLLHEMSTTRSSGCYNVDGDDNEDTNFVKQMSTDILEQYYSNNY